MRRSIESLVDVLWLGIPLLVALVGLLAWFLVGRALRPVDAIRAEVDEISHGDPPPARARPAVERRGRRTSPAR